ncbi:hypothetical protein O3G_MSEX011921 [Manduca sexta]|uniref:Uncharacterized protein n=1 Tax=Manduca sexta TaxID=7130 RepID=A0A921ZMF7_MANSE|nr:hypothetical protein O3G_MSEX011921 [Manduca sexta]
MIAAKMICCEPFIYYRDNREHSIKNSRIKRNQSNLALEDIKYTHTHIYTQHHEIYPRRGIAEAQPGHPLFAKCVPFHDVIGEPIAISGTNSRLRADTKQKNPNITLPDPGFELRTSERCRTVHAVQLRH